MNCLQSRTGNYHNSGAHHLQEMQRQNIKSVTAAYVALIFSKTPFAAVSWHSPLCWMWGFIIDTACYWLISVRKLHLFLSYFRVWQEALSPRDKHIKLYLIWHEVKQCQFEDTDKLNELHKHLGFVGPTKFYYKISPQTRYSVHSKSLVQEKPIYFLPLYLLAPVHRNF